MSGHYQQSDLQFFYPENWQVTDEETSDWPRSVSVQSPAGAFWSVMLYQDASPADLTQEVLESMRSEYDDIDVDPVSESIGHHLLSGYDMCFCCLDLVVRARTLATQLADRTVLLLWQAEDREGQQLEAVFRAITTSLLQAGGVPDSRA